MEELTFLQAFMDFMASDTVNLIVKIISRILLCAGILYSVIHLVKLMFEPEETHIEYQKLEDLPERLIS